MCFTRQTVPARWPQRDHSGITVGSRRDQRWISAGSGQLATAESLVIEGWLTVHVGATRHTESVQITEVTEITPELMAAFERLIPQLSRSNPPPSEEQVQFMIDSPASVLLIAEEDGVIYGSLTLALFRIPTAMRAWIEDVVVDDAARGKGVGRLLNEVALERAREAGAKTVDLTSRPSREAANRLYQRIGFEQRDTNVYRYNL